MGKRNETAAESVLRMYRQAEQPFLEMTRGLSPGEDSVGEAPSTEADVKGQEVFGDLSIIPGAMLYRGFEIKLQGRQRQVLLELLRSRFKRVRCADLKRGVFDDSGIEAPTIKTHISDLRKTLRAAMEVAGVPEDQRPADPLHCVGRGDDLAWELKLPGI